MQAIAPIVEEVLEGFNCTIFACAHTPFLPLARCASYDARLPCLWTDMLCNWKSVSMNPAIFAQVWADGNGQDVHNGGAPPSWAESGRRGFT